MIHQTCVYLLHFARPLAGRASHYIGTTTLDGLVDRIARHRAGHGARITAAASAAGIEYTLVRTWTGGRGLERRLKRQANAARWCPICRPAFLRREAARLAAYYRQCQRDGGLTPPAPPYSASSLSTMLEV